MGNCGGNCASCSGCARELVLSEQEVEFLQTLGQIPFLPVARKMGDLDPVYLESGDPEEMGLILQCLHKKGKTGPWMKKEKVRQKGRLSLDQ